MNPWKENLLTFCRNVLRFVLWLCLAANGVMLGIFSILFTFEFLRSLWQFCARTIFANPW